MGKSIALAVAAVLAVAVALAVAVSAAESAAEQRVMTRAMSRAEAEAIHYARLWTAASEQHVVRDAATGAAQKWRCCRPCAQNTVPILHEAFEGDKNDAPEMTAPPPADEKKADAKLFVETASASASASHGRGSSAGNRARAAAGSALTAEQKSEFAAAQKRKHEAQQDALHGVVSDATAYSCCNMCPDLMYPFPGTWNRPSPYSYVPQRFRFARRNALRAGAAGGAVLAEVGAEASESAQALARAKAAAKAAVEAQAQAEAEAEMDEGDDFEMPTDAAEGVSKYQWTNPHDLPVYRYWESLRKAAAARDKALREGWYDAPVRPGAAPIWHPPPPPHDDIYRIARSPNLHDGVDLQTPPFLPPCCDFCMSTYFPHVINDELQLPKYEPYSLQPVSLAETAANAGGNHDAISAAEAYAKTLPSAKSDPKKCCHKCVRKDIEDTDWQIYALPPKPKKSKNPLRKRF